MPKKSILGQDPRLRQLGDRDVEIAADQGRKQQQHGGSRTDAEVQIGATQRAEDEQEKQNEKDADENGKEAWRQREVVELAHLHRQCSAAPTYPGSGGCKIHRPCSLSERVAPGF
jgi:hypothetical protein